MRAAKRSRRVQAAARRAGLLPAPPQLPSPARPIGIKFEITYACNLRCGFCYTDSPRHTLARTPELSDEDVLRVVDDAIELGVIEAVVTGGEPFLRKELALAAIERFGSAGVHLACNTNGWFVDDATADRLAAVPNIRMHISLDGATPELHERARGVPGSWGRATRAIARLAERGVPVQIVHVVTPDNVAEAPRMVEQAWLLGAESLVMVTVVPVGGAARGGRWAVDARRLRRAVERERAKVAPDLPIRVDTEIDTTTPTQAPRTVLVRPDGGVRTDSINPFRFGHALDDGLAACWERIVADWDHPRVRAWREPLIRGRVGVGESDLVPYRDEDAPIEAAPPTEHALVAPPPLPAPVGSTQTDGSGDFAAARSEVVQLALARRYDLGPVRFNEGEAGARYVRVGSLAVTRLNPTAALVMDACSAGGTPAAAAGRLAAEHPEMAPAELELAAITTARRLATRGILRAPDLVAPAAPAAAAPVA